MSNQRQNSNFKTKSLIWVLADDRPGNYSQAIGLAEALKRPYEIKKISYNSLIKLPNFLKGQSLIGLTAKAKSNILNQQNKPKIIISCGRRSAAINLFLKKHYGDIFSINIMNPNIDLKQFDLVIMPEHDNKIVGKNIINSIGSLSRVEDQLLKEEYKKFADKLSKIKAPIIALLVGGSSKKGQFDVKIAKELAEIVSKVTDNMKANLLVTTSRRTGDDVTLQLENNLKCQKSFFAWQENKPNPYFAFLQKADYIIVTGDSMSMCSESCSSGKPVYIYNPPQICSKKHLRFHQGLFSNNYAKNLSLTVDILDNKNLRRLDETTRIANEINKVLIERSL